jgi:hypothetical protein
MAEDVNERIRWHYRIAGLLLVAAGTLMLLARCFGWLFPISLGLLLAGLGIWAARPRPRG